jgi:two-component system OmpR family sensor kinase
MQWLHTVTATVGSLGQSSTARRVVLHVLLVLAAVAIVAAGCLTLENRLTPARVTLVLALFAAVGCTAAALLAVLAARLTADHRIAWLSMVLGCYSLLAIPITMIDILDIAPAPAVGAVRFLVHCVIVALLLVALIAQAPPAGWRAVRAVFIGAALIAAAGALGFALPTTVHAITMSQPLRLAVALAWSGLASAIAGLAAMRQAWALWQVGAGLSLLGIAHAWRVSTNFSPTAELGLVFSSIRLLAVGLMLWGTLRLAMEALDQLADKQAAHEEDLRLAEIRLARAAERDHELRNGLAGLAGATSVMGADRSDPVLTKIVTSELCRLDELLRAPGGHRPPRTRRPTYAIGPVLNGLVALREATGMDIRLDTQPGLRAIGSSTMLAQVVTNLIGNAARHAPGTPVRLSAFRDGDEIVIHVRDFGPGVPPGREQAVFEPRVRDERASGTGLGLHICRGLLEVAGGSIAIRPSTPDRVGCTVVVRLPAAPAPTPASRSLLPAGVSCVS